MTRTLSADEMRESVTISPADRVTVGGMLVDRFTAEQWVDLLIADWRRQAPTKIVTTANGQVLSLYWKNEQYRHAVAAADHVAPDGMSIVTGSRWFTNAPIPERVATTDWFHNAARGASENGLRFYLLGAAGETIDKAAANVQALYPKLELVGWRDGYFSDQDLPAIAAEINRLKVDVLWLGVGNPRQVIIAHKLRPLLTGVTWIRTCGGLFDFLAQKNKRAPLFLQKAGLEWAWRVAMEPRRLLWRYVTTNIHSSFLIATRSSPGK